MCKWGTDTKIKLYSGKVIKIDSCLKEIIEAMDKFGVKTVGCCCGHGKSRGSIMIDNERKDGLFMQVLLGEDVGKY